MTRLASVRVTMRSEVNSIPVPRNCVLEATQLPDTFKTGKGRVAEGTKITRLVRVTIRSEANSIPVPQNCVLEATQLAEVIESIQAHHTEIR